MGTFLAIVASIAVVFGFATAVIGLLIQRRIAKQAQITAATAREVQQISVQVDGRLSMLLERQAQLLGALHESGTPVPPRPPEKTLIPPPGGPSPPPGII